MDVEKTIEFLLNSQAGHDERLTRIETNVDKLTVDVASLSVKVEMLAEHVESLTDNVGALTGQVGALTENGAKLHESVRVLAVTVDKMADSIVAVNRQSEARDQKLGERIDQLTSAVTEFVRNRPSAG